MTRSSPVPVLIVRVAVAALLAIGQQGCGSDARPDARGYRPAEGDVLFQSLPPNELVDMIEGATESPYSHCGIVVSRDGEWNVLEAIGTVHETPLDEWIARGREGEFWAYRLNGRYQASIPAFVAAARAYTGRPYDYRYAMNDSAIYCSELVYKAFGSTFGEKLGVAVPLGNLKWQPFERTIRSMEDGGLPLDRVMITPRDLAKAEQLQQLPLKNPAR